MEELIALTEKMAKDGNTPWCIGLGSGDATGWPGTDWMEDIMLRTHAPSVYDAWVTNEMPFNDPKVIEVWISLVLSHEMMLMLMVELLLWQH